MAFELAYSKNLPINIANLQSELLIPVEKIC